MMVITIMQKAYIYDVILYFLKVIKLRFFPRKKNSECAPIVFFNPTPVFVFKLKQCTNMFMFYLFFLISINNLKNIFYNNIDFHILVIVF